jgi:hypothetical protein
MRSQCVAGVAGKVTDPLPRIRRTNTLPPGYPPVTITFANMAAARGNELGRITTRYQPLLMSTNNGRDNNKLVTIGTT